jgi:hypothetical protein
MNIDVSENAASIFRIEVIRLHNLLGRIFNVLLLAPKMEGACYSEALVYTYTYRTT